MPSDHVLTGNKVIVISNEDCPLLVGEIIGWENFGKEHTKPLPIVKEDETGKEFICFGILKLFSTELFTELSKMNHIERWNKYAWNKIIKRIRFYDIEWDTTEDDNSQYSTPNPELPSECVLDVAKEIDLDTEGADVLSDKYGWCVFSFDYEIIEE